jgi:formylglycine-generating enzyme required for sulfatase activity
MGDNEGKPNEQPVHIVKLDAFYIDIHEVTVGRYTKFLAETRYRQPNWNEIHKYSPTDDHPVIHVSWYDAMAYCEWVGKRLPTEAEWEYSARGGLVGKKYSWGNSAPTPDKANYWNDGSDDGTTIVGSYPANGYGLYDAVGNVYEWCLDAYDADYYSKSPKKNPLSSLNGTVDELTKKYKNVGNAGRVFRGGPWTLNSSTPFHLRVADRGYIYSPEQTNFGLGFRCVADVPPPEPEKD